MAYEKCPLNDDKVCPICTEHNSIMYCGQASGLTKKGLPANQIMNMDKCPKKK